MTSNLYDQNTCGTENLVPTCTAIFENAWSDGANTSIEDIHIDPGYWRATETSDIILACYNEDACLGGITGEVGYCREGYYGPCKTRNDRSKRVACTKFSL